MKNTSFHIKATQLSLRPLISSEDVLKPPGLTSLRILLMILVVGSLSGLAQAPDLIDGDGFASACRASEAARDAIDAAEEASPPGFDNYFQFRDLIKQAEEAASPPEWDSGKALILAQEAIRLAGDSVEVAPAAITPAYSEPPAKAIVEFNLSQVHFDDSLISGSAFLWGLSLGHSFDSRYEMAFSYSQGFPLISPSLDSPAELDRDEFLDIQMQLLSLRRNWKINEKFTAFALIGYSKIKFEIENLGLCIVCGFTVSSETTYRNTQSGPAWGVGMQWKTSNNRYGSLKYMDHSESGFGFTGIHLNFGWLN